MIKLKRELVLVDGNSLATAAYYALPPLTTSSGKPTGATYGFINSIFKLLSDFPTHFGVVFDKGTSRRKGIGGYKENRNPLPDDAYSQYEDIKRFLNCLRIPFFSRDGYEGDDILAIFAHKFHNEIPVIIATRDKDLLQLCALSNVYVMFTKFAGGNASTELVNATKVKEIMGVEASQVALLKALAGDSSDNFKGVPGIGPKTAIKLIDKHHDYAGIIKLAEEDSTYGRKIRDNLDDFKMCWDLAELRPEETKIDLGILARRPGNEEALHQFYVDMEFRQFL